MREIKLRGKRIDNGEWVYGDMNYGLYDRDTYIDGTEVITGTVSQCTGLKDRNGAEIYEGDVVSNVEFVRYLTGQERRSDVVGVVRYDIKSGCLVINNGGGRTKRLTAKVIKNNRVQVIGNIYENPERMEERQ